MNWEKKSREDRLARLSASTKPAVSARKTFEALSFFFNEPEEKGGNLVVVPVNWNELSESELHRLREAHQSRECALKKVEGRPGHFMVRLRDETVKTFELRPCEICSHRPIR